jgi:LysR family transcriptional regulator, nitrogen assimilation regulatory protein
MDLKQIEYFVRVAELGSFTRASALLGIAQPALSRQVRLLEVELRQNLLLRNGRGATPTEAGKLLLEHGRGILHQVERTREDLGRVRGALAGRVAVGMPTSVAKVLTVPLIRAFQQRMPEASLSISEGLSVAMHESLTIGRLDIALLYNPLPAPDIELAELLQEDLVLVQHESPRCKSSKASKAISLRELAGVPLIIPTRPNALRTLVETELSAAGQRATIALEIDGVAAMLDLVADDAGAAILPANAVRTAAHPEHYSMRPIEGLRSRLSLATSAQRPATLTQREVQTLITELVKKYF